MPSEEYARPQPAFFTMPPRHHGGLRGTGPAALTSRDEEDDTFSVDGNVALAGGSMLLAGPAGLGGLRLRMGASGGGAGGSRPGGTRHPPRG